MPINRTQSQYIESLGYKLKPKEEITARGLNKTILIGTCPIGHEVKVGLKMFMSNPTCKQCYYDSMTKKDEHLETLEGLGYKVSIYTKKIPSGRNKTFLKGVCPNGHAVEAGLLKFMLSPHCKKCPNYKSITLEERLTLLKSLGYNVEINKVHLTNGGYRSVIAGSCPQGHTIDNLKGFISNPRCKECYLGQIKTKNLEVAINEGYKVEIVNREVKGQSVRTYFIGECPNKHKIDMKVVDFISGNRRCSPCKKEAIIKRVEQVIAETDYDLKVERGVTKNKDRDSRLYVVGTCPVGHKVRMMTQSFESGARCKGCTKYGFSTGRSAVFYLISGSNITVKKNSKARDGIVKEVIVKYGVFHPGSGRLMIHGTRGFNASPLFSLYHTDSKVVAELEKRVGELLAEMGVKTCKEIGLSFDGATESFLREKLEIKSFITSIKRISKEIETEYGSNFQTITTKEAMVIGDRSRSVATKNTIAKTIYSLDTKKTDKPKTKKRPKGYAHV